MSHIKGIISIHYVLLIIFCFNKCYTTYIKFLKRI